MKSLLIYNKLNCIEPLSVPNWSKIPAETKATIRRYLNVTLPDFFLPGNRVKMLDGKALATTEHRLRYYARPIVKLMPGKSLVVLDPA